MKCSIFLAILCLLASHVSAQQLQRSEWGAVDIKVQNIELYWLITGQKNVVTLSPSTLSMRIQSGATNELTDGALKKINRMRALHQRLALAQMTNHEFLDKDFKKERTTFSDGTTVTLDWTTNTVTINPEP